jgi:hypothetical protein
MSRSSFAKLGSDFEHDRWSSGEISITKVLWTSMSPLRCTFLKPAISPALESFTVIPKGFASTEAHTATGIPILKDT